MTTIITIIILVISLLLLCMLAIIDLKTRLLPNKYVAAFSFAGAAFHINTNLYFTTPTDIALGMLSGFGLLMIVRTVANKSYKHDTLGLGDVKLMAAAGIWLGLEHIFLAISLGAFAGLIHGVIYSYYISKTTGKKPKLSTLSIPAGPGFIIGIIIVGSIKFTGLIM